MRRPATRHRRAVAASLVLATAVGGLTLGCGKTDTSTASGPTSAAPASTTTPAAPLTKEQYVEKANAACRIPNDESTKIDAELRSKYPDPKAVPEPEFQVLMKDAVARLLPLMHQELDSLHALNPPAADAPLAAAGVAKLEAAVKAIEAKPDAIGDPTLRAYPEGYDYGLTDCYTKPKTFQTVASAIS